MIGEDTVSFQRIRCQYANGAVPSSGYILKRVFTVMIEVDKMSRRFSFYRIPSFVRINRMRREILNMGFVQN